MTRFSTVVQIGLLTSILFGSVLGYVELALNRKSNITFADRFRHAKRGDLPLGGGMTRIGYYFVQMQIGSQMFRVDIDTGSSTLYVVGPDCHFLDSPSTACSYAQSYYQGSGAYLDCPRAGCSDCQKKVCIMYAKYGDGSQVYGAVRMDSVVLGDYSAVSPIAVSYLQSSDYTDLGGGTFMDGLWGMAYSELNGNQPTVMDKLVASGMPDVFSMCFSKNGGYLVMGGVNPDYHTGTPQYTPITKEAYYSFSISRIAIGSTTVSNGISDVILDSGTTFSYLSQSVYNSIANELIRVGVSSDFFVTSPDQSPPCVAQANLATKPSLTITLPRSGGGSFDLTLDPTQYTFDASEHCGLGFRVFAFVPSSQPMSIFGDSIMTLYNNIFDRAGGRLGFAPVNPFNCKGYVALNPSSKKVPGTKSQFSSSTSLAPPVFALLLLSFVLSALI